jgi:hypothetical protein
MMLSLSNTLLSPLSSGSGVPALPAGLTNRWTAPSTGSDGDLIATLTDSIAGNNGTAAGSARPTLKTGANGLNGRNVLRFDGVANSLTLGSNITGVNTYTIAVVMKRTGADMCPLGTSNFLPGLLRTAAEIGTGDANNYQLAANTATGWEIIIAGRSANNSFGTRNGTTLSFTANVANPTGTTFSRIGSRFYVFSNGDFADIIYWPAALTNQQMLDATANLNATWGGVY